MRGNCTKSDYCFQPNPLELLLAEHFNREAAMAFLRFIVASFKKAAIWATASAIIIATGYYSVYPMEVPTCCPPIVEITESRIAQKLALSVLEDNYSSYSWLGVSFDSLLTQAISTTSSSPEEDFFSDFEKEVWFTHVGYQNQNGDIWLIIPVTVCGTLGTISGLS